MPISNLNLRHLLAVVKVADFGKVNAAALAVNLTQPAITQALGRLEGLLGQPLFERRPNGMVMTRAAELLVPRLRTALAHVASPQVTMSRMRALIALADGGSYAAASAATGLSVPSLHRAVNDLALSLRRPLTERRNQRIALTEAGLQIVREFRLARVELETGLAEVEALSGRETRRIAIGAMPLARARVLPAAVTRFMRRHPLVSLSIAEGSRGELLEPLRNGALDIMVGALREPLHESDLVQLGLFEDISVVIARKGHPLEGTDPGVAELAKYAWILPGPGTPLRQNWQRMFEANGREPPQVPIESGSAMMIRQMLIGSDLLTLLSPDQVKVELEAGWLTQICAPDAALGRTIGITSRASWRPSVVQQEFLDDLRTAAEVPG